MTDTAAGAASEAAPGAAATVRVRDLARAYGSGARTVHALRGISFDVAAGELVAVRGRSGSGKTTLLNALGGLDRPDSGSVHVAGQEVTRMAEPARLRLRRETVAFVFQGFGLVPVLTARENVEVPLRLRHTPGRERDARVAAALESVGLAAHADQRPDELSGGQQQRVGIARALVARPTLLIADEPTGQLDSETAREIMTLLREVVRRDGVTAVVATHDAALVEIADRVLELRDGALIAAPPRVADPGGRVIGRR